MAIFVVRRQKQGPGRISCPALAVGCRIRRIRQADQRIRSPERSTLNAEMATVRDPKRLPS